MYISVEMAGSQKALFWLPVIFRYYSITPFKYVHTYLHTANHVFRLASYNFITLVTCLRTYGMNYEILRL